MSRSRIILVLVIIGIALFSSWILESLDQLPLIGKAPPQHVPDYYLEGFDSTVYNVDGKKQYVLQGQRLEHYPDDNSIIVLQPRLSLSAGDEQWQLKADKGVFTSSRELIHLMGKVRAYNSSVNKSRKMSILTESLDIHMARQYAETGSAVTIEHGEDEISANGMQIDLKQGQLKFMSDVKGIYEIPAN